MSEPIDDGGPAFPQSANSDFTMLGMTLRDYFAAKAMQAITLDYINAADYDSDIARTSYRIADAMLAARKEKP